MRASSYACRLVFLVCLLPVTDLKPVLKSVSSSVPNETLTAHPGDVTLTCVAPNVSFEALELIRPDLEGNVIYCQWGYPPVVEKQSLIFKGRVIECQMTNDNVSVIIKNATYNDSGKYECHYIMKEPEKDVNGNGHFGTKSSYNINLNISGPIAGDENGGGGNGTNEDHSNPGGMGLQDLTGLAVGAGLLVAVLVVVAVAVFIFIRKCMAAKQKELSSDQRNAEGVNETLV